MGVVKGVVYIFLTTLLLVIQFLYNIPGMSHCVLINYAKTILERKYVYKSLKAIHKSTKTYAIVIYLFQYIFVIYFTIT